MLLAPPLNGNIVPSACGFLLTAACGFQTLELLCFSFFQDSIICFCEIQTNLFKGPHLAILSLNVET